MDILAIDVDFQNLTKTLRIAPWLDMPKLRDAMQKTVAERLKAGDFEWTFKEFQEDLAKFSEGEYKHVPRTSDTVDLLADVLSNTFPDYRIDSKTSRSLGHISKHLITPKSWTMTRRMGDEVPEEDPEDMPF